MRKDPEYSYQAGVGAVCSSWCGTVWHGGCAVLQIARLCAYLAKNHNQQSQWRMPLALQE